MSRKIKFRAFDLDAQKREMIYNPDLMFIENIDGMCALNSDKELADYVVLMQYTGLKDKNGKEIYEGDIVKSEDYYKGEVIMGSHNTDYPGSWVVKTHRTNNPGNPIGYVLISDYCEDESRYVEVIGNIYENSLLLGDKNE